MSDSRGGGADEFGQHSTSAADDRDAAVLAASIFLDILSVFLLLLSLFGGGDD